MSVVSDTKIEVTVKPETVAVAEILTKKEERKFKARAKKAVAKALDQSYGEAHKPKRPPNAYNLYVKAQYKEAEKHVRERDKIAAGTKVPLGSVSKVLGQWWKDKKAAGGGGEEKKKAAQ